MKRSESVDDVQKICQSEGHRIIRAITVTVARLGDLTWLVVSRGVLARPSTTDSCVILPLSGLIKHQLTRNFSIVISCPCNCIVYRGT